MKSSCVDRSHNRVDPKSGKMARQAREAASRQGYSASTPILCIGTPLAEHILRFKRPRKSRLPRRNRTMVPVEVVLDAVFGRVRLR
jgi:hypothetical protein